MTDEGTVGSRRTAYLVDGMEKIDPFLRGSSQFLPTDSGIEVDSLMLAGVNHRALAAPNLNGAVRSIRNRLLESLDPTTG